MTLEFLDCFTGDALLHGVKLQHWLPSGEGDSDESLALLRRTVEIFGPAERAEGRMREWELQAGDLDQAVTIALEAKQRANDDLGPIELWFAYQFFWKDQTSREHYQRSLLGVSFSPKTLFLQPMFCLPYSWVSPGVAARIAELQERCPFRFREQYFKRAMPAKKGDRFRFRSLQRGWLATQQGAQADGPVPATRRHGRD